MKKIVYMYLIITAIIIEIFLIFPLLQYIEVRSLEAFIFYAFSPILSFAISTLINLPIITLSKYIVETYKYKEEEKKASFNIKDITYFRDKLPGANPGVLSLILDKKVNYKDAIMASLFSLKLRKYLDIKDNKIIILKNTEGLLENEKLILNSHRFIFTSTEFKERWLKLVEEDAYNKGFITKRETAKTAEKYEVILGVFIFITVVLAILASIFPLFTKIAIYFYSLMAAVGLIYICLSIIEKIIYDRNKTIKTTEGFELYNKLLGLKKFLKDFSIIDNREKEELLLWEDYIIYAIIFDFKGTLDKDVLELYDKLKYIEGI